MKIINNRYKQVIDFDFFNNYVLAIENSNEYLKVLQEIFNETNGIENSEFVLSDNGETLKFSMLQRLIRIYILNLFDLLATMYLVMLFGVDIEGNIVGKWLIETKLVYFFKIVIVGILLFAIYKFSYKQKTADLCSRILFFVFTILSLYHCLILFSL